MPVCYSEDIQKLENKLAYFFRDRHLLAIALTHKSFHHENPDKASAHNERLEFLGDSVLGLIVADYLFRSIPELTESSMAKIKSFIVRGSMLAEVAADLSIGQYLRLGRGEADTGGRRKENILADAMEAVIGAVYMDGGYETARELVMRFFRQRIETTINSGQCYDYKTELQEKSQEVYGVLPEYRIISEEGEEHQKVFNSEVFISGERLGSGRGKSKKEAQTLAAKEALLKLKTSG